MSGVRPAPILKSKRRSNATMKVQDLLPSAPQPWLEMPANLVVGFGLSEGGCLYRSIWKEYDRDSFAGALKALTDRVPFLLIGYQLVSEFSVPGTQWVVDWPLARRGKSVPAPQKEVADIELGFDDDSEHTFLTLYQSVPEVGFSSTPSAFGEPTIRLRVAGYSAEDVESKWHQCARGLRGMKSRNSHDCSAAGTLTQ